MTLNKNIFFSLISNLLPLISAIFFFPDILKLLGNQSLSLFILSWALINIASIGDFGISKTITKGIAEDLVPNQYLIASMYVVIILSILTALLIFFSSTFVVNNILKVTKPHQVDLINSFRLIAFFIPLIIHTNFLRSILDGRQLFISSSVMRAFFGFGFFAAPYFALKIENSLIAVVISHMILRFVYWLAHLIILKKTIYQKISPKNIKFKKLIKIISYGTWISISNIVTPALTYIDRFIIVIILGEASLSYYVMPFEIITKLLVIPAAIGTVLYAAFPKRKNGSFDTIFSKGFFYTFILVYPPCVLLGLFSKEWIGLWLNNQFTLEMAKNASWIALGVLFNSLAQILFAKIQAKGHAKWSAKLHISQIIPFIFILVAATHYYGIVGAAFSWFFRILIDSICLLYMVKKIDKLDYLESLKYIAPLLLTSATLAVSALTNIPLLIRFVLLICYIFYFFIFLFKFSFVQNNKNIIFSAFQKLRNYADRY